MMDSHSLDIVAAMIRVFFQRTATLISNSKTEAFGVHADKDDVLATLNEFYDPDAEKTMEPWLKINSHNMSKAAPLVIETYLDLRDLDSQHTVHLKDMKDDRNWNVCKGGKKMEIVLERWLLELDTETVSQQQDQQDNLDEDDLSYFLQNKLDLLLRYLHTLITLLPATDLYSKLLKNASNESSLDSLLRVSTRILDGTKPILSRGRIGLSKSIIPVENQPGASHLEQKRVPPIATPVGLLRVNVSYRKNTDFEVTEDLNKPSALFTKPVVKPQVGSVGSGSSAVPLARNPSNSSVIATLRAQRSSNGSINAGTPVGTILNNNNSSNSTQTVFTGNTGVAVSPINTISNNTLYNHPNDGLSRNSIEARFSSSFDKVRRHSNVRKSDDSIRAFRSRTGSLDPQQQQANTVSGHTTNTREDTSVGAEKPNKYGVTGVLHSGNEDEILDFMRMLDEKKDLKLTGPSDLNTSLQGAHESHVSRDNDSPPTSEAATNHNAKDSVSDSLIRFKMMKLGNDNFTENLSMSISINGANDKSNDNFDDAEPPFGFSPQHGYDLSALRASFDNRRPSEGSSRKSANSNSNDELLGRIYSKSSHDRRPSNSSLPPGSHHLLNSDLLKSSSPTYSLNKFATSLSKANSVGAQTEKFFEPTTASAAAYGNFHKPKEMSFASKNKEKIASNEDDDLLFFMSDMNKNE
ncbi:hypothetical protein ACO0QE_000014 [Hanseniaspora vineae]